MAYLNRPSRKTALLVVFFIALCGPCASNAQSPHIQYIIPDEGAAGMCVQADIIGPADTTQTFGNDSLNPFGISIQLANLADTSRVRVGSLVVRDYGRLIHTVFFINPGAVPGGVPIQVWNGKQRSNTDTFFIVNPDHVGVLTGGYKTLGDGTAGHGKRSKRGTMVVDSLILNNGIYGFSTADTDPKTPGNQGFLPVTVLVQGRFYLQNLSTLHCDGYDSTGAPGGGGGESNVVLLTCQTPPLKSNGGDGFCAGDGNDSINYTGTGSYANGSALSGTSALNGGGPAFPFESGLTGGAGGNATQGVIPGGGGGGGNRTAGGNGNTGTALNGGSSIGSRDIVPLCGGGGGGAGTAIGSDCPVSGEGGGGGGALMIYAGKGFDVEGLISANGANGGAGICINGTSSASGGGGGAAGSFLFSSLDTATYNGILTLTPGNSGAPCGNGTGGGQGGSGRIRIDGAYSGNGTFPENSNGVNFLDSGLTLNPISLSLKSQDTIRGFGMDGATARIYLMNVNGAAHRIVGPFDTSIANGKFTIPIKTDSLIKATPDSLVGILAMQSVTDDYTGESSWTMGQASALIVNIPHGVITFNNDSLNFGNVIVGQSDTQDIYMTNTGTTTLHVTKYYRYFGSPLSVFTVTAPSIPFSILPGRDTTVAISFTPQDTGQISDYLVFESTDAGTASVYVGVNGFGAQPAIQTDSAVAFGIKQVDAVPRTRYLHVHNNGSGTASLSKFTIAGDTASYHCIIPGGGVSIPQGITDSVAVSFIPKDSGEHTASMTFTANDTTAPHVVALSGEAVDSAFMYATHVCFPSTSTGDTMLTICNATEDTLENTAEAIAGSTPFEFSFVSSIPSGKILPGTCYSIQLKAQNASAKDTDELKLSFSPPGEAAYIQLTTNCDLTNAVSEPAFVSESLISHYPEPFTDHATFIVANAAAIDPNSRLFIMDVLGRCVATFNSTQLRGNAIVLNGNDLPTGVYYFRLAGGTVASNGAMVHFR